MLYRGERPARRRRGARPLGPLRKPTGPRRFFSEEAEPLRGRRQRRGGSDLSAVPEPPEGESFLLLGGILAVRWFRQGIAAQTGVP